MHQGQGGHTEADSYATDGEHDAPWVSGRTDRGEPQGLEEHQILVAAVREVIPRVGSHTVVEVLNPEVGPGIP